MESTWRKESKITKIKANNVEQFLKVYQSRTVLAKKARLFHRKSHWAKKRFESKIEYKNKHKRQKISIL